MLRCYLPAIAKVGACDFAVGFDAINRSSLFWHRFQQRFDFVRERGVEPAVAGAKYIARFVENACQSTDARSKRLLAAN